ncbi:MAG TPA: glycosyltransferase family 2 protein [Candidatus Angelobacter sp.]
MGLGTIFPELVTYAAVALIFGVAVLLIFGGRVRRASWLASILGVGGPALLTLLVALAAGQDALPFIPILGGWWVLGVVIVFLFNHWNAPGHIAFTATAGAISIFLAYVSHVIVTAPLNAWTFAFASALLVLQIGALALLLANMFEIIDVVCRIRWRRRPEADTTGTYVPKVSLHLPIHAEPPELVIETLNALGRLDYANYEVLVIDNNTRDESLWRPVEAWCASVGKPFRFFHLLPWPGYKSGALNFALSETASNAEIIAVVDADYVVDPSFLKDLIGFFATPQVAFVQTPQDYRDQTYRERYAHALYFAYQYFFQISMVTRNEYNGIIYAGTMGLIRRSALEQIGGWDEWCVTEDAEVSLRLLDAGYESVYVQRAYGRGIMPLDYRGLRSQRYRWAFGGMQILRKHAGKLLNPWSKGKLTMAQRLAYLNGGLQWLNGPIALSCTAVLLVGSAALLSGKLFSSRLFDETTILIPSLLFISLAVVRFMWALRLRARCTWKESRDALTLLLGLSSIVALACIRGLVSRRGVFRRTPKKREGAEQSALSTTLGVVWFELVMGTCCLAPTVCLLLMHNAHRQPVWGLTILTLLWQAAIYFAAVCSSFWSYVESRQRPGYDTDEKDRNRLTQSRDGTVADVAAGK